MKVSLNWARVFENAEAAASNRPLPYKVTECGSGTVPVLETNRGNNASGTPNPDTTPERLSPETIVFWGDEPVRLKDLMVQDRKTVEWNETTGRYEGGYPF